MRSSSTTRSCSYRRATARKSTRDDVVEVSPTTVKREEHGFIRGRVVADLRAARDEAGDGVCAPAPELVDAFVKRYSPGVLLRVHVKLDEAKTSGPAQAVSSRLCRRRTTSTGLRLRVVVNRSRPERCARPPSLSRNGD